jgi:hypothetical protein
MGKKRKPAVSSSARTAHAGEKDHPVLLNELLSAEIVNKLKAQAEELKKAEANRKEEIRKQEEEKKKLEQKRLENDFSYLLENSDPNWSKHK